MEKVEFIYRPISGRIENIGQFHNLCELVLLKRVEKGLNIVITIMVMSTPMFQGIISSLMTWILMKTEWYKAKNSSLIDEKLKYW